MMPAHRQLVVREVEIPVEVIGMVIMEKAPDVEDDCGVVEALSVWLGTFGQRVSLRCTVGFCMALSLRWRISGHIWVGKRMVLFEISLYF